MGIFRFGKNLSVSPNPERQPPNPKVNKLFLTVVVQVRAALKVSPKCRVSPFLGGLFDAGVQQPDPGRPLLPRKRVFNFWAWCPDPRMPPAPSFRVFFRFVRVVNESASLLRLRQRTLTRDITSSYATHFAIHNLRQNHAIAFCSQKICDPNMPRPRPALVSLFSLF